MSARSEAAEDKLSNYYFLTRTFLYINKRLYRDAIQRFADDLSGLVVDVGCGQAPYRPLLTRARKYAGIDAVSNSRADILADAQRLPVADNGVDSILCTEVLEHVVDPDAVMIEAVRVLRPGGALLVTAPMSWNLHYEPTDYRRYTCYGLWQLLESHGFQVVETRRIGGLFSLVGSRLVDGVGSELYRRLEPLPPRIRHAVVLCYSIPMSLLFSFFARIGDRFESTDAIGWAVLATKAEPE
nr:class I SAM-dependent methyltransferase [Actinomycetota bacterium]